MLKSRGILNAQLLYVMARLGHKGLLAVVDAGYNIPQGVDVVDLAFSPNVPTMLQVLDGILNELAVERLYVSEKIKVNAPDLDQTYQKRCPANASIEYLTTQQFRNKIKEVKAVVRTGCYGLHSPNLILQAGCAYE